MAIPQLSGTVTEQRNQAIQAYEKLEGEQTRISGELTAMTADRDAEKARAEKAEKAASDATNLHAAAVKDLAAEKTRADKAAADLLEYQNTFKVEVEKAASLRAQEMIAGTGREAVKIEPKQPDPLGGDKGKKLEGLSPRKRVEARYKENQKAA